MGPVRQPRRYTREEFLTWEEEQEGRWELLDGVIKMRSGGSVDHNVIAGNVVVALRSLARGRGCEAFQQNQKLAPDDDEAVVYPDVFVACRKLKGDAQMVGGACVIVEVVSKTSRDDDVRRKLRLYKEMPEPMDYLVVESLSPSVTHHVRTAPGQPWQQRTLADPDARLTLASLNASLTLAEIYDRTDLPP